MLNAEWIQFTMRIACFFIPLFPLAARLRSEPELGGSALVIVEGSGTNARVFAASRRARKQGVHAGITLAQARAILPGLAARVRDSACEHAAQEALLDVAESLSPRVEDAGEGVAFVDLEGLERIYEDRGSRDEGREARNNPMSSREASAASDEGSPSDSETAVTHEGDPSLTLGMTSESTPSSSPLVPRPSPLFVSSFAHHALSTLERAGLPARVGIASSKLAARVAAELPETPTIVPEGEETSFLAPLPLGRLSIEMEIAERLARWGIRSIGELARLPEREVASRLGETGRALHYAARGIDFRPLIPRVPPPDFREGMDLEWPLVALEPFLFVANAALDRLTRRLAAQGLACRRLELELRLEPEGWHVHAIELPAPTRDVKTLLALTRLDLEEHPPGAPVAGFVFVAHPDQPRAAQLSLYGPLALSPDRLATTIARLAAIVGTGRVGTPIPVDSHLPERFTITDYAPPSPPKVRLEPARNRGLLAVRVLRPAVEIEVEGRGAILDIRAVHPDDTLRIDGRVRVASGPWTMEEGWWSDAPAEREYWDVELERGGIYRIYRDRDGRWFADGVYD